jgi:DNA-binding transcriptional ArsR family regulator
MSTQDEPMKLLKPISEEAFKQLGDETRRKIMFLLRDHELTVKEISSELNLTTQNIYHHMKRLQEVGLVKVSDEKRSGHLIESYYTTTADTFFYYDDKMEVNLIQSFIDVLNGLNEMDIPVEVSEQNASELSELNKKRLKLLNTPSIVYDICASCSFSGFFMKFGPMNPVLLSQILQYSSIINMTDEEFEESLELTRKLRQFLLSISKPKDT